MRTRSALVDFPSTIAGSHALRSATRRDDGRRRRVGACSSVDKKVVNLFANTSAHAGSEVVRAPEVVQAPNDVRAPSPRSHPRVFGPEAAATARKRARRRGPGVAATPFVRRGPGSPTRPRAQSSGCAWSASTTADAPWCALAMTKNFFGAAAAQRAGRQLSSLWSRGDPSTCSLWEQACAPQCLPWPWNLSGVPSLISIPGTPVENASLTLVPHGAGNRA